MDQELKELEELFGGTQTTKKRKLIISPYEVEETDKPSLVFPDSPNFNIKKDDNVKKPEPELPINPDILSYDLDYDPFNPVWGIYLYTRAIQ